MHIIENSRKTNSSLRKQSQEFLQFRQTAAGRNSGGGGVVIKIASHSSRSRRFISSEQIEAKDDGGRVNLFAMEVLFLAVNANSD